MMRILIATSNPGKAREFRQMLGDDAFQWEDLRSVDPIEPPPETGASFEENAMLKAAYYARHCHMPALADDSGLEVDALKGKPGIHSARWAQMHHAGKGDADNNRLLLQQLSGIPDEQRGARFVCALALADERGDILATRAGRLEGTILRVPRGSNGFGYDPLFLVAELGKTTAELTAAKKGGVSHRGRALREMRQWMQVRRLL